MENRQLGLFSATSLVVASMIGTGVFTTTGFLLEDLKSRWLVVAAWIAGGMAAALGASCYGALARRIPESGGEYLFLSRTLHPAAGFLAGWVSLLVGFSAPLAAAALGFGEYTKLWFANLSPEAIGTGLIVLFTLAHAFDSRAGAALQNGAVTIKLVFLAVFLCLGASRIEFTSEPNPAGGTAHVADFAVSLVWISFSYSGWNAAIYISGEVRDAERTVPRAMLLGTVVVAFIYAALNGIIVMAAPASALSGKLDVARVAAEHLGGPAWAAGITALVALALLTSVSSLVMSGPRVYARMAEDGCLPRWLKSDGKTPRSAIVFQCLCALLLLWTASFKSLLTYIGFTLGLSTAATVAGLILSRLQQGPKLNVTGWPVVPGLFIAFVLFTTGFTIVRQPIESMLGGATLLAGLIAYWLSRRAPASRAIREGR